MPDVLVSILWALAWGCAVLFGFYLVCAVTFWLWMVSMFRAEDRERRARR